MNGFCGGFVNGSISGAGTALGNPFLGNLIGGFIGNEITENFNNMDVVDSSKQKEQVDIFYTSLAMGGVQAVTAMGPIAVLAKGAGASGKISQSISKFFAQDLAFLSSINSYIFVDGILKSTESSNNEEIECLE